MPSTPSALVFDLDGTLSDPAVGIGRSLNHALTASGFPPILESQVSRYIGPPLDQTFRAITGTDAPGVIQALVARYRERYADVGYAENVLYAGMSEAVAALAQRGLMLGVCTSKRVDFAEKILQMFGLRSYFAFVDGGEIGTQKVQQLQRLLDRGAIDVGSTMIGDRAVDVVAARSNGLRSVGVLWGHGTVDELHGAGADAILTHVAELALLGGSHGKEVLHEGL